MSDNREKLRFKYLCDSPALRLSSKEGESCAVDLIYAHCPDIPGRLTAVRIGERKRPDAQRVEKVQ